MRFKTWLENTTSKCYFFGTFDPIHNDHVKIATSIAKDGHIIVFVPAFQSPDKVDRNTAPHFHRVNMCKIVTDKHGWLVEDVEKDLPKPNKSLTTINKLEPNKEKVPFFMGADNIANLHKWHGANELAKKLQIYTAGRDGLPPKNDYLNLDVKVVEPKTENLASTIIRNNIKEGKPWQNFVDPDVAKYIKNNYLYGASI